MPPVKTGGSCKALDCKAFVLSQKERQMCEINHCAKLTASFFAVWIQSSAE